MKTFRLLYTYSKGFTALAVLCLVAACQPGKPYNYKSPQVVADPDKVSAQLAQAADQASQALQTLAARSIMMLPVP